MPAQSMTFLPSLPSPRLARATGSKGGALTVVTALTKPCVCACVAPSVMLHLCAEKLMRRFADLG